MKDDSLLVSIVIPCYNLGQYLKDAIDSALGQTYKNKEVIVIDDGSTDDKTIKLIDEYRIKYQDVVFIRQNNMGLSEARNTGVKKSKGDYIVCLDADDKLFKTYIEELIAIFKKDSKKKLGFVTTWLQEFGLSQNIWKPSDYNPGKLLVENIAHAGSMFRKEAWTKAGGYKKQMVGGYEDWEFWVSLMEAGYKWAVLPKVLFNYRIRKNSMFSSASAKHQELYQRIVGLHSDLYSKYASELALWSAQKINTLRENLDAEVGKRDKLIRKLYKDRAILKDDLSQILSSKTVSSLIKITKKKQSIIDKFNKS